MDVVYIVRPGDYNEELRYSLRSLSNITHDAVWMAGYRPFWVSGVGHIPTVQYLDKHANSTANVRAACEHAGVSDPFILFNDDFFVTRPVGQVPAWHRGSVAEFIRGSRMAGAYRSGAAATAELLTTLGHPDPNSYELHTPLIVDKQTMLRALDLGRGVRTLHKRTLYANLAGLGGHRHDDVKVDGDALPDKSWPFWSTSDMAFTHGRAGQLIRGLFGESSPYEVNEFHTPEEAAMPVYVNTRTGALTEVADPADIKGRKAAVHARRTIERMDRSRRWRRATAEELAAAGSAARGTPMPTEAEPGQRSDGVHPVGGGWHEVVVGGEVVDKVRGSEAANDVYVERTSDSE